MISNEQIDRLLSEMSAAARQAIEQAQSAERALEDYTYRRTEWDRRQYDPSKRARLLAEFREADYLAESRSWIVNLIRQSQAKAAIPHNATCFFRDGDKMCCVFADFRNLQESPAGFGNTFDEAFEELARLSKIERAKAGGQP